MAICAQNVYAQEQNALSAEELAEYKSKARDITGFYFYLLNTLAGNKTSSAEKEIIVTNSYKKYFLNEKVQIEDDLDTDRTVPTNKNVAAYLKDVDFFFKDASFEFEIQSIEQKLTEKGRPYFLVELSRKLKGFSVEGDTIENVQKRFLEINITESDQDLRIASVYTSKLSLREDLVNWWSQLPFYWKTILKKSVNYKSDTLDFEEIREITEKTVMDLSNIPFLDDIKPLSKLSDLKYLDISNTIVEDLSPLRSLGNLEHVIISNTSIENLEGLQYSFNLKILFVDNTPLLTVEEIRNLESLEVLSLRNTGVENIEPLKNLTNLKELYLENTFVSNLKPLTSLSNLQALDISSSNVTKLPDLRGLKSLELLDVSDTSVDSLAEVSRLGNLVEIRIDNTPVTSLIDLRDLSKLKKIYSDYSGVTRAEASRFMAENPGTLVIFASDELLLWWQELPSSWRNALLRNFKILEPSSPSKEELAFITRQDSLNLSSSGLQSLEPIYIFNQVLKLNISDNFIKDIRPLMAFPLLEFLDISRNPIDSVQLLKGFYNLETAILNNLGNVGPYLFDNNYKLEYLSAENTAVNDDSARVLLQDHPDLTLIYKTPILRRWWTKLDIEWKDIFAANGDLPYLRNPSSEELHQLVLLKEFDISNLNIKNIDPLKALVSPKKLILNSLPVQDFSILDELSTLESLEITRSPVHELSTLSNLNKLRVLKLNDTPVAELDPLSPLKNLEELDVSNTKIKSLKALKDITGLKILNIANTDVKKLKYLEELNQLKEVICYNTRISENKVRKFKRGKIDCRVIYF